MIQETVCRKHPYKPNLEMESKFDPKTRLYPCRQLCWECFVAKSQTKELEDDLKAKTAIAEAYLEDTLDKILNVYAQIKDQIVRALQAYRQTIFLAAQGKGQDEILKYWPINEAILNLNIERVNQFNTRYRDVLPVYVQASKDMLALMQKSKKAQERNRSIKHRPAKQPTAMESEDPARAFLKSQKQNQSNDQLNNYSCIANEGPPNNPSITNRKQGSGLASSQHQITLTNTNGSIQQINTPEGNSRVAATLQRKQDEQTTSEYFAVNSRTATIPPKSPRPHPHSPQVKATTPQTTGIVSSQTMNHTNNGSITSTWNAGQRR